MPRLENDFHAQVCAHVHEVSDPPRDQRLPLLVAISRKHRLVIIEGYPDYEELRELLRALRKDAGAP